MIDCLNDDTICCIFALLKPNSQYFRICKKIHLLRTQYLIMHYDTAHHNIYSTNIYFHKHRNPVLDYLLRCYENTLKHDIGHYRKYIIQFIANRNRTSTIYQCKNDYHRLLVHQFCDAQGLLHETVETSVKGKPVCQYCQSAPILIIKDEDEGYYVHCYKCQHLYWLRNYPEHKILLPHKSIKITKK